MQAFTRVAGTTAIRIEGDVLKTGYEANEEFLKDRSEEARLHDNATNREAKRQFVNKLDEFLKTSGRSLSEEDRKAIMRTSVENIEGFLELPKSVVDIIDESGISFSDILDGVSPSNPNVLTEVESALTSTRNGEDIKKNIYNNIESRSGNWWSDEEFKEKLEESAAKRWDELKEEDKRLVAASQE